MMKRTQVSLAIGAAFSAGLIGLPSAVLAQQQLERVEVTGSSIKRIEGEAALPVQVITREEIQRTGVSNVEQLMQTISAMASSQATVAASAAGATTLGLSGVSLRGLSSLRTLVLINGKRVSPYGYGFTNDSVSVDVNSIPLSAIERVEILKDGASAIYGSDAIAGVVNFIMRRDYVGAEISAEYGQPNSSAGSVTRVNGVYGVGDAAGKFNLMFGVNYHKEKPLYGRDRSFAKSGISVQNGNDTTSGNTFPANVVDAATGGDVVAGNPSWPGCPGPYATKSAVFDAYFGAYGLVYPNCRFDPSPLVALTPDVQRIGIYTSGFWTFSSAVEGYFAASFSKNEQTTQIQPTPISDQFALPPNNPLYNVSPYNGVSTIIVSPASPYYPTDFVVGQTGGATPDLLVRWRAASIGDRRFVDTSEAPRLNLGVRGAIGTWDYDAGYLYSGSTVTEKTEDGYAIQSKILPLLNSDTVNFWGPNTEAVQAQLNATKFNGQTLETKTSLSSWYAKASSQLFQLPAGPLAAAFGGEFRGETYKLTPSPEILQGDLTGYGGNFLPVDVERNVKAVYAEFAIPIVRSFDANIAVRYDDYENVGSKTVPKVSLRWQPVRQVLLRGAYGEGFRAPSLLDLYAPQTTGVTPPGLSDPLRCPTTGSNNDCNTQFPNLNGGNVNLKPEESKNYTLGVVFEPTASLSLSVDWFKIDLTETINNGIPAATILDDLDKYGSLVTRGPADPLNPGLPGPITSINQTNINTGRTIVQGYDVDARYRVTTGVGNFIIGLSGTYFTRFDQQNEDGSFSNAIAQANNSTGGVVPRWKHYLSANWSQGPWSATLAQSFQTGYHDLPPTFQDPTTPGFEFPDPKVGTYTTYDIQGSYQGYKNLTLTAGIRNLFDQDPPYTNAGGQVYFQAGYDPGYVDPRGRFYYARMTYKFF